MSAIVPEARTLHRENGWTERKPAGSKKRGSGSAVSFHYALGLPADMAAAIRAPEHRPGLTAEPAIVTTLVAAPKVAVVQA